MLAKSLSRTCVALFGLKLSVSCLLFLTAESKSSNHGSHAQVMMMTAVLVAVSICCLPAVRRHRSMFHFTNPNSCTCLCLQQG